jgi:hypothetical protein
MLLQPIQNWEIYHRPMAKEKCEPWDILEQVPDEQQEQQFSTGLNNYVHYWVTNFSCGWVRLWYR